MDGKAFPREIRIKLIPLQSVLRLYGKNGGKIHYGIFDSFDGHDESEAVRLTNFGAPESVVLADLDQLEIVNPQLIELLVLALSMVTGESNQLKLLIAAVTALNQFG